MLTGDNVDVARRIADHAGLDGFTAEMLPDEKRTTVQAAREQLGSVAMIGDGVNDAPALATSSVGIAMGAAASDTALETADVAILGDDLRKLPFLVRLSRRTSGVIRQNVAVSLLTKAALIVTAVTVGLPLWLAVLGDVGVSLLVTLNGLRLLRATG
jgi:Cd2+/Zn2+-exporting ATPase